MVKPEHEAPPRLYGGAHTRQTSEPHNFTVPLKKHNPIKKSSQEGKPLSTGEGFGVRSNEKPNNQIELYDHIFTTDPENWKLLNEFARDNRKTSTPAENALWQQIRNKGLGVKFRRQHAFGSIIVDFVCLSHKLVVEVDGGYHEIPEQAAIDISRDEEFAHLGYKVLRFENEEVFYNMPNVLKQISEAIHTQALKHSNNNPT